MKRWLDTFYKIRFYVATGVISVASVSVLMVMSRPATSDRVFTVPSISKPALKKPDVIIGKPVRLVIPSLSIDLPVDEGNYNPVDASWTLSGYHAHFAMPTMLANDQTGNTLIYGHNNKYVFGPLKHLQPGAIVEITTDNHHLFYYKLQSTTTVLPDDLSTFAYEGPPILTLQTCTGNWHELRTMSTFTLDHVVRFNPSAAIEKQNREKFMTSLKDLSKPTYLKNSILKS